MYLAPVFTGARGRRLRVVRRRTVAGANRLDGDGDARDSVRRAGTSAHQRAVARRLSRRRCSPAITAGCSGIASRCSRPRWCRSSRSPGARTRSPNVIGPGARWPAWPPGWRSSRRHRQRSTSWRSVSRRRRPWCSGCAARDNPDLRNRAGAALWTLAGLAIAAALFLFFFAIPHWSEVRFYNWQMSVTRKPSYGVGASDQPRLLGSRRERLLPAAAAGCVPRIGGSPGIGMALASGAFGRTPPRALGRARAARNHRPRCRQRAAAPRSSSQPSWR